MLQEETAKPLRISTTKDASRVGTSKYSLLPRLQSVFTVRLNRPCFSNVWRPRMSACTPSSTSWRQRVEEATAVAGSPTLSRAEERRGVAEMRWGSEMELWPLRLFSSRLSSACPGTQHGRMAKVRPDSSWIASNCIDIRLKVKRQSLMCRKAWSKRHEGIELTRVPQQVYACISWPCLSLL